MRLDELAQQMSVTRVMGDGAVEVRGVAHDSRNAKPGDLFACLVGANFDGHRYAADALARGATALLVQQDHAADIPRAAPALIVPDTRTALPHLAAAVYGWPSRAMKLVGVTGTNGKTTTTILVASILRAHGLATGTIGTLGAELDGDMLPSDRTTPEADQVQGLLASMRARGAAAAAMEVSSHALVQHRTDALDFDAAAFTNLTQDHLDYHRTMDEYYAAKRILFTDYPKASNKPFVAAVNADDQYGARLAADSRQAGSSVLTYAQREEADVRAHSVRTTPGEVSFECRTPAGDFRVELRIGGAFQAYNALAAITVGVGLGIPLETIARGLVSLAAVPGRFESVPTGRGYHVIVDYAHTPDGLDNLISAARRLEPARVIVVFGCGGDRDRTKRPIMGGIAAARADVAVVTSDNPRSEDPGAIIDEVVAGMHGGNAHARLVIEQDRRAAIAVALAEARTGDVVLIAGKGHEDYQIVGSQVLPFDDRQVAREILATLPAEPGSDAGAPSRRGSAA